MTKFPQYIQKNSLLILVLGLVLLIGLWFRTYAIVDRFEFAHDGDLYSWFVKNVVVDKHIRLIGQLTTAPGIFIGPLFYYALIPFFLLTKMDPIGTLIPITLFGLATIASYYSVFSKLFNKSAGIIAAFLHSVLISPVYFDRAVVPSTPTHIWMVWYFYCVISIVRGNYRVLWILGLLLGLIWHIHIALLPALIALIPAVILAKKLPSRKGIFVFLLSLTLTSIPLILFEVRHNFSQTKAFMENFTTPHNTEPPGFEKLNHVLIKITRNFERLFFYPSSAPISPRILLWGTLISSIFLIHKKLLTKKDLTVAFVWFGGIIAFYSLSSSQLSEYYFTNIEVIYIAIVSLWFAWLFNRSKWRKYVVVAFLLIVGIKNAHYLITQEFYQKGYNERRELAEFITEDSREKGYPCVAVSYITSPGEDVGFRYFFWLENLHVNKPISGSPVYSIVQPRHLAQGQNEKHFGQIKVIPPPKNEVKSKEEVKKSCSGENSNLADPMFGFTK